MMAAPPVPSGDELGNWVSASLCEIRWMEGGLAVALVALRPVSPWLLGRECVETAIG